MKAVVCTDIHLGRYKYGKVDESGNDSRTQDILNNLDKTIDFAIERKVNAFIGTGDFYHIKKPSDVYKKLLVSKFERILDANIKLYLLVGNHDQGKTAAHNLSELKEISSQISTLNIIEKPEVHSFEDCIFYMLPYVNKFDLNLKKEDFAAFQLEHIRKFSKEASSKKLPCYFFGHFGTNMSQSGGSFDLGSLSDLENSDIVDIKEFDKNVWTKVYLGHIHKQQEINETVRHVGSIARVDFGEEFEQKGFYYFEDGKDEFIKLQDRNFKTLDLDLLVDKPRDVMANFCEEVQDLDLSETIVRLKVKIRSSDKKLIKFDGIEEYLKESCWTFIGKTITEINDDKETIHLESTEDLNYVQIFNDYIDQMKLKPEILEAVKIEGEKLLTESL